MGRYGLRSGRRFAWTAAVLLALSPSGVAGGEAHSGESWGTKETHLLAVPGSAFAPVASWVRWRVDSGVVYPDFATGSDYLGSYLFWAPVELPSGLLLEQARIRAIDNVPGAFLRSHLQRVCGTTDPVAKDLLDDFPQVTVDTAGVQTIEIPLLETVVNAGCQYTLLVEVVANPPLNLGELNSVGLVGADLRWRRQEAPPPGLATFGDVPPGHVHFGEVENLAAAGITLGCGGVSYCPDQAVTRGQMAAFLSRALGLYWPVVWP